MKYLFFAIMIIIRFIILLLRAIFWALINLFIVVWELNIHRCIKPIRILSYAKYNGCCEYKIYKYNSIRSFLLKQDDDYYEQIKKGQFYSVLFI